MKKLQIRHNYHSRGGMAIAYIVLHDTGKPAPTADAMNHFRYFDSAPRGASCHYVVDDGGPLEICSPRYAAWHCGDGGGKFGITNENSIGVELCVCEGIDRARALSHLARLVHYLMLAYDIPRERVVRHYDASRKCCPRSMNADDWAEWKAFSRRI